MPDPNSKISLEELLKLKRAERPSSEFWSNFERELRQKQLTALVKKRRWWHDLALLANYRVYLPAGAAAAVALGFSLVRLTTPTRVGETPLTQPQTASSLAFVGMLPDTMVGSLHSEASHSDEARAAPMTTPPVPEIAHLVPVLADVNDEISPSARSIAANLARLEQSEPELLNAVMGNRLSSPARSQTVAASVESESIPVQRYRLIARYADRAL
ncbi:MAG TPA: hypothetical protein VHS96_11860, partial [Bacteroidia bacterium]|nr:hypothetical protein [Bacteroidia bacterium]